MCMSVCVFILAMVQERTIRLGALRGSVIVYQYFLVKPT